MARRRMDNSGSVYFRTNRKLWIYKVPKHLQVYAGAKTISAKTQRELKEKMDNLNKQLKDNNVKYDTITIPKIITIVLKDKLNKNIITNSTYGRDLNTLAIIQKSNLNNIPIQQVTTQDIDKFAYTITDYSQSSIDKIFIQLKIAFNYATAKDLLLKNILTYYKRPISTKETKKVYAFTLDEQKEFIRLIPKSIYFMQYMIALNTGMRMGEINALHIDDIDFINKEIHINKTVSRDSNYKSFISNTTKTKTGVRSVPINNILMPYLIQFCENKEGYLFSDKRIISTPMVNSEMKRLCAKSEIITCAVNTHMLRHTFATRCIESGMPPVVLAKLLGHADISTTLNTYTDVFNKFKIEHFENATNYIKNLF